MPSEYSSILLRWKGALREIQRGVKVQDYSAAIVMIEQLIASGAAALVTDDDAFTSRNFLERMPRRDISALQDIEY